MAILFKRIESKYKVYDNNRWLGYANKEHDGWYVSAVNNDEQYGPFPTRKKAGSKLRQLSNR